ncbi:DinB family protein [Candidatus Thorarchaeota archaeon]|nr:MAG: DinB family protein [Candidatus Thorarchaeota archaeon]
MFEQLEYSIKSGLRGRHIHIDPLKALEGIDADKACKVPSVGIHSVWQILHHIVYWQDLMLSAIRGEEVQWPKNNDDSWLKNGYRKVKDSWDELHSRFKSGIEEAEELCKSIESLDDLPSWPKVKPFAALMVFAQHNAYHLGEIVATRQALGFWPPPDYKPMF